MAVERFKNAATEAANRAEATALLIRCGYRVYRPEADIGGEDLVVRNRAGTLLAVQLKSRLYVDEKRYGQRGLMLLFPSRPYQEDAPRHWYLVPHDELYAQVKERHGDSEKWANAWSAAAVSEPLRKFLADYILRPPAEVTTAEIST